MSCAEQKTSRLCILHRRTAILPNILHLQIATLCAICKKKKVFVWTVKIVVFCALTAGWPPPLSPMWFFQGSSCPDVARIIMQICTSSWSMKSIYCTWIFLNRDKYSYMHCSGTSCNLIFTTGGLLISFITHAFLGYHTHSLPFYSKFFSPNYCRYSSLAMHFREAPLCTQ